MSSLQESPENVKQVQEKSSTQEQSDKQPNLLDIEITDDKVALNVMVMFLNLAQNRGAFRIDESAKIFECIKTFQKTASQSQ